MDNEKLAAVAKVHAERLAQHESNRTSVALSEAAFFVVSSEVTWSWLLTLPEEERLATLSQGNVVVSDIVVQALSEAGFVGYGEFVNDVD